MENENKEGKIDNEVLEVMKDSDILTALGDDRQVKRLILNCFCEFLSEIKDLKKDFDEFMQFVSVCGAEKFTTFFNDLKSNVKEEVKHQELEKKISKSHLKAKKPKNVVNFPKKNVK